MLSKSGTKYLCANHITAADISFGAFLIKFPYNDKYDYQHIIQAVFLDYPKVKAVAEQLKNDFSFYIKDGLKSPF